MLKPLAFANAFTVVGLAVYILCRFLALLAPDFLFSLGQSWFHTFSLSSLKEIAPFDLGLFLSGGITLGVLVWLTAYLGAYLYNKLAK